MEIFLISGQSFIKENCHNSRTIGDIDMKFGPITKFDKRNKTSGKFDDEIMLENCGINLEQFRSQVLEA